MNEAGDDAAAVEIWNVFLPKPEVPPAIAANYRNVKVNMIRYNEIHKYKNRCLFNLGFVNRAFELKFVCHMKNMKYVKICKIFPHQIEWTKQLVAQQRQKTERIEKETQKIKAIADAEREKEVEMIEIEKKIQVRPTWHLISRYAWKHIEEMNE